MHAFSASTYECISKSTKSHLCWACEEGMISWWYSTEVQWTRAGKRKEANFTPESVMDRWMITAGLTFSGERWCRLGEVFPLLQIRDFSTVWGKLASTVQHPYACSLFRNSWYPVKWDEKGLAHGKFWGSHVDSAFKQRKEAYIQKKKEYYDPKEKVCGEWRSI